MRKNKFVILSICLLVGLSGCTSLNQTKLVYSLADVQEVIEVDNHKYAFDIEIDLVDDKNNAYFIDTDKNVDVFKEDDDEESIEESEEDEDTIDPNIPFQAGRFEWWWIVVIVGTIALIFFIAWLVFFIWDRKDKKKYKKKQ